MMAGNFFWLYSLIFTCPDRNWHGLNCSRPGPFSAERRVLNSEFSLQPSALGAYGPPTCTRGRALGLRRAVLARQRPGEGVRPLPSSFGAHPSSPSSRPFSRRKMSKNRRAGAAHIPYYHVFMGMQIKVYRMKNQNPLFIHSPFCPIFCVSFFAACLSCGFISHDARQTHFRSGRPGIHRNLDSSGDPSAQKVCDGDKVCPANGDALGRGAVAYVGSESFG